MRIRSVPKLCLLLGLCFWLAGCGSIDPVPYRDIPSAPYLRADPADETGNTPYRYAENVDWSVYRNMIIDPVEVYKGTDSQFDEMTSQDKAELARYMQSQFYEKLSHRFRMVRTPEPQTLRLKLTLTGAVETTPVLGTFSRIDLAGGLYNVVQSIRGGEGTMTGSVLYAAEIYDASTSQLLYAYVTKQYPNSLNIAATFGSLAAAKEGIEKGAEVLAEQLSN